MKPPVPFKPRGIHHMYLGFFFVAFGAFFLYMNAGNGLDSLNYLYGAFIFIGLFAIIDDIIEHTITEDTILRRIWNKIIGVK
jgi:hypothetical protein